MNKNGTTLLETLIAIFLMSVVIVTFLEAMNIGIMGTLKVDRRTSALNLAKSQIEYIKTQTQNASSGNLSDVYGLITTNSSDITDTLNYGLSGQVENVGGDASLQKITVNVSYLQNKVVQLISYKSDKEAVNSSSPYKAMLVTDVISDMPILWSGSGGSSVACNKLFHGYYHVFNTSGGLVSVNWNFNWNRWDTGVSSLGAPMMAIYPGTPDWANRDYLGVVQEEGIIYRCQCNVGTGSIGDLPGPGEGAAWCNCFSSGCSCGCSGESDPVWFKPHDCLGLYNGYPCSGACLTGDLFWTYDLTLSQSTGTIDRTETTTLAAGSYTVLFFNAENKMDFDTVEASITYWK